MTEQSGSEPGDRNGTPPGRVVIVGPDGMSIGEDSDQDRERPLVDMVEQPAKVMRIGTMIKQLLEEVRAAPLDEASRARLRDIHRTSIRELEQGLAPELREELERLTLPFSDDTTPSDAELRIAQAQLVGWLEGLFHGIQTALFAQQMAARAQLEEMRRRAPGGMLPPGQAQPIPGGSTDETPAAGLQVSTRNRRLMPQVLGIECSGNVQLDLVNLLVAGIPHDDEIDVLLCEVTTVEFDDTVRLRDYLGPQNVADAMGNRSVGVSRDGAALICSIYRADEGGPRLKLWYVDYGDE